MINCFFKLIAASRGFACYLHGLLVYFAFKSTVRMKRMETTCATPPTRKRQNGSETRKSGINDTEQEVRDK